MRIKGFALSVGGTLLSLSPLFAAGQALAMSPMVGVGAAGAQKAVGEKIERVGIQIAAARAQSPFTLDEGAMASRGVNTIEAGTSRGRATYAIPYRTRKGYGMVEMGYSTSIDIKSLDHKSREIRISPHMTLAFRQSLDTHTFAGVFGSVQYPLMGLFREAAQTQKVKTRYVLSIGTEARFHKLAVSLKGWSKVVVPPQQSTLDSGASAGSGAVSLQSTVSGTLKRLLWGADRGWQAHIRATCLDNRYLGPVKFDLQGGMDPKYRVVAEDGSGKGHFLSMKLDLASIISRVSGIEVDRIFEISPVLLWRSSGDGGLLDSFDWKAPVMLFSLSFGMMRSKGLERAERAFREVDSVMTDSTLEPFFNGGDQLSYYDVVKHIKAYSWAETKTPPAADIKKDTPQPVVEAKTPLAADIKKDTPQRK